MLTFSFNVVGSVSVLDSSFNNVKQAIVVKPISASTGQGSTGISLENVALSGVGVAVADTSGATLLASSSLIDQWVVGPVYEGSTTARTFSKGGKIGQYRRHRLSWMARATISSVLDLNTQIYQLPLSFTPKILDAREMARQMTRPPSKQPCAPAWAKFSLWMLEPIF